MRSDRTVCRHGTRGKGTLARGRARRYGGTMRRNAMAGGTQDCAGKRNVSLTAGVRYVLHTHLPRRAGSAPLAPAGSAFAALAAELVDDRPEGGKEGDELAKGRGSRGRDPLIPAILNEAGALAERATAYTHTRARARGADLLIPFLPFESPPRSPGPRCILAASRGTLGPSPPPIPTLGPPPPPPHSRPGRVKLLHRART